MHDYTLNRTGDNSKLQFDGFYLYMFHHDDDLRGWTRLENFNVPRTTDNGEPTEEPLAAADKARLLAALKHAGWEGDGVVEGMIVPPFLSTEGDNYWFPIYHVKQSNNGTSYIASEQELGFSALSA